MEDPDQLSHPPEPTGDGINPPHSTAQRPPEIDGQEALFLQEIDRRGITIVQRPGPLLAAEVLTWVGTGVLVLFGALLIVIGATMPSTDFDAGITSTVTIGMGIGGIVQAAVQAIGAWLLHLGRNAGRVTLTVVGVLNVLVDIEQIVTGQLIALAIGAYVVVTVAMMWAHDCTAYLTSERQQREVAAHVHNTYPE